MNLVEAGSGPPLLLVHGFPSNALSWRLVMERLVGRRRMLAPDQVGFGRSTRRTRAPLTDDAYADRLARLLDVLEIERADVAGLSWGGAVAQRLALRHPERVGRLVLAAAVSAARPLRLSDGSLLGLALGRLAPPLARGVVRRYLLRATAGDLGSEVLNEVVDGYVEPLRTPGALAFLRRFVRATRATPPADVSPIEAPTLVVVPDADRVIAPAVGHELAATIPTAQLEVLPDVGHAVQFEAADRLADLLDQFLAASSIPGPVRDAPASAEVNALPRPRVAGVSPGWPGPR